MNTIKAGTRVSVLTNRGWLYGVAMSPGAPDCGCPTWEVRHDDGSRLTWIEGRLGIDK